MLALASACKLIMCIMSAIEMQIHILHATCAFTLGWAEFAHTQLHSARARENNGPHKRGRPGFRG